jgi:hypothetical protein
MYIRIYIYRLSGQHVTVPVHDVDGTEATLMWLIATSARLVCSKLANQESS